VSEVTQRPDDPEGARRPLPPAGGHYRHAIRKGNLVFTAGQVGWDDHRQFADGIVAQTRLALDNLRRALESAGASLGDLVTVNAYLADLNDFARYDETYRDVLRTDPPARTSIGVDLAEGCLIEIAGIAVIE
jgi:2-iminobutanoate/2-iminopropanoate deaminase